MAVKSAVRRKPFVVNLRLIPVAAEPADASEPRRKLMKSLSWFALWPAAFVLVTAVTHPASARERETVNQAYDTGSHPRLSLKNINGDLTLDGWDKNRIEVTAEKTASSKEDLDDIRIDFRKDGDYLSIDVKLEHEDGWSHHGEGPRVDFTVHVPRGTEVDQVELVNGDVDITAIEGDVDASSVNGQVSGEKIGGDVDLSTVNGGVSLVATGAPSSIRMNSVNGGVTLVLPKKFDARIEAGTLHGDIVAIHGLDVDATSFTGSSMKGIIGKGTMKVDLNTVNGSIAIKREGESGAGDRG
jgi:DUF4097 and DUF4098 domain-containing protein YvlB